MPEGSGLHGHQFLLVWPHQSFRASDIINSLTSRAKGSCSILQQRLGLVLPGDSSRPCIFITQLMASHLQQGIRDKAGQG